MGRAYGETPRAGQVRSTGSSPAADLIWILERTRPAAYHRARGAGQDKDAAVGKHKSGRRQARTETTFFGTRAGAALVAHHSPLVGNRAAGADGGSRRNRFGAGLARSD